MVIEGGTKRGVDRKVDLAGVTRRNPDALEFSVLKANERVCDWRHRLWRTRDR
jgi:hypothetical protein